MHTFFKAISTIIFSIWATFSKANIRKAFAVAFMSIATPMLAVTAAYAGPDWVANLDDVGSDPTPAGGTILYNAAIDNNGDAAPATTVDIDVLAGATIVSVTGGVSGCTALPVTGPGTVTCTVPALASLASIAFVVGVIPDAAGSTTLSINVPTTGDDDVDNNSASESTTVTVSADIELGMTGPTTVGSGGSVTYSLTATNLGLNPATNLVLEFPVPTGMVIVVTPPGCTLSGATYTCNIPGPIAVGDDVTIDFTGQISAASGSTVTPVASITGSTPADPVSNNNTASLDTDITAGSDVFVSKNRLPAGPLLVGDTVTFTLSPSYTGDSPTGLTISDTIPANYSIVTPLTTTGGWTCTVVLQDIDCTKVSGTVSGADVSLDDIIFDAVVISSGVATNTVTVGSAGPIDPMLGNNTATDGGVTISDPVVDLRANKSGPVPALVVVGQNYNFNINMTNDGNADFFGTAVMTDHLPAGLTINGFSLNGWMCPAGPIVGPTDVVCTRVYTSGSPLAAGATTPTVTMDITATAAGTLNNTMTVSSPDANIDDLNPANDTTGYSVTGSTGGNSADVAMIKTADVDPVIAGEIQTYHLEIVNLGPQSSLDVEVLDNFTQLINNTIGATGAGYVGHSVVAGVATGISCSTASTGGQSRRLTCDIVTLPTCTAGLDCPIITVEVRPGGNATARSNTASAISQTTADPNLNNNSQTTAEFDVEARADVTVTKTASPSASVKAGQNLTYVITATNLDNGLSSADNVTIVDSLPDDVVFVSASPSAGSCSVVPAPLAITSGSTVECNLGTINNGAQRTVTIVVRPTTATRSTSLVNNVAVSTSTTETDGANNTDSVSTPVDDPVLDLLINKMDSVDPLAVGDDTVYTVTVTNLGPSAAENLVIIDEMPADKVNFQSFAGVGADSCSAPPPVGTVGANLSCTFAYVPAGESRSMTITARGIAKGNGFNDAHFESTEFGLGFDSNSTNDAVNERTTVRTKADMEVTSKVAVPGAVNLFDNFNYVITVSNLAGLGLAEADDVVVSDTLPANMVLTGAPAVTSGAGNVTSSACTGVSGGTSFSCDLGTFSYNSAIEITVPVEVIAVTSKPQTFTNSATVATSSKDDNPANDTNTGDVEVGSSTLSGQVFRDFNDNGIINGPSDTGVGGVTMTLSGLSHDGVAVTATAVTLAGGTYTFPNLPEGTYQISRGAIGEPNFVNGTNTVGDSGGTLATATALTVTNIGLGADANSIGYLFAIVPQASIGIAKAVSAGPTPNEDGSFNVTFNMIVENFSLEALDNISVTDPLSGASPLFGTYDAAGAPFANGEYTIASTPSGSCGDLSAGFTGAGGMANVVAGLAGFTLAAGGTCNISFELQVQPTVPLPTPLPSGGWYDNQATVTGEGTVSGQTSTTNPLLIDISDNGTNPDPNGDSDAGGAGEDDPTPVTPAIVSDIALVKTSDISALSTPPVAGEVMTFGFAVTNTGDVTLTNIVIADPLAGIILAGNPIASLAPGATDSTTITATYAIIQDNVDDGEVTNQASVVGTDPYGDDVTDDSGTSNTNDAPLVTPLVQTASIALIKTADTSALQSPVQVNDIISYTFTVENTGNVTLTNVTITDILPDIILAGGPIVSMLPGAIDTTTFTATYAVKQGDIDAGRVENSATVTGSDPGGNPVTDVSGSSNTNDTPTIALIGQSPSIDLVKTADVTPFATGASVGDIVNYTFTITNTGNVTLTGITLSDILADIVLSGGPIPSLVPGGVDNTTFTATYALKPADIAAGQVVNNATATGNYEDGDGNPQTVSDSDEEIAIVVSIEAVPEVFPPFITNGGTTTSMLASDTVSGSPATLTNVTITVDSTDPEVTLDPATGLITLAPDSPAGEYTVTYTICSVIVPTVCDTTTETVVQLPIERIETTKTSVLVDNGDGVDGVGDTVEYTITVANYSNVTLENVGVLDTLTDLNAVVIALDTGPTFVTADMGSVEGDLLIGEMAEYAATHVLTISDVSAGGISNTVTASGIRPSIPGVPDPDPIGDLVTDISDDGIDSDGNMVDDPTVTTLAPSLEPTGLTVLKTTPTSVVLRGSVVPYTITVQNTNPFVSGITDIVDVLPAGFLYETGTATLNGTAFAVLVEGQRITWPSVPVPPLTTITLTLSAYVTTGANAGDHTNVASILNPGTREPLAPDAKATVRIDPEHVFDCGDVIGKVFDDQNHDGYHNEGEPGMPGVRVVTVNGLLITTDEHGRFHVPCAALPADNGSNFILKLDTRTLPTGYRLTTENPRVVRLTSGKLTKLNFGVSISNVIRIDINGNAFEAGSNKPSDALIRGIRTMIEQQQDTPSTLRISYFLRNDSDELAHARMDRIEAVLRDLWPRSGDYKLNIEKTFMRTE